MRRVIPLVFLFAAGLCAQPVLTHGQASGDPRPDGVSIWARSSQAALVSVYYATNPLLIGAQESPIAVANTTQDFSVRIDLNGLQPGSEYWYRLRLVDPINALSQTLGPLGRFQTAATPTTPAPFSFSVVADIRDPAHFDLFTQMEALNPDLGLFLGDWPYTDASPAATTLSTYRQKHREARSDPRMQSFFSRVALAPIWDDHEVMNNWDGNSPASRVSLGRQVWKEFMPVIPNGDRVYRSLRFGSGAEIFILDTRSYRAANNDPDVPGKPLLGPVQMQWLKDGLSNSDATFKFIASSVPVRNGSNGKDHWQGFLHEREELLEWIAAQRIPNVILLSGDQHYSSSYDHRQGIPEFQCCPIATSLGTPPVEPDFEVSGIWKERSFGMVRVDPGATPPVATIEIHGASGLISSRSFEAAAPGLLSTAVDGDGAEVRLVGPHHFRSDGLQARFPRAAAGDYAISFRPPDPSWPRPGMVTATLPEGGFLAAGAAFGVDPQPAHPLLFRADFGDDDLSAWTVIDEGVNEGPSSWFVEDYALVQSTNINGGSGTGSDPVKPGTQILAGNPAWSDYSFSFRVKSTDNDAIGALFRVGSGGHYRFSMDSQRGYQRLVRKVGSTTTILAERAASYSVGHWYEVTIKAIGPNLSVFLDGELILSAVDSTLLTGRIGLYCWANQVVWFDAVRVHQGDLPLPSAGALFHESFTGPALSGFTVVDQGTQSGPSNWMILQGELVQTSNINGGTGDGSDPHKPGSYLVTNAPGWGDFVASIRMRNDDDDAIGLMFRVVDPNNGYRFSMDSQRGYRRLCKIVQGVTTTLVEDAVSYQPGSWYEVSVRAVGPLLQVWIDGELVLETTDSSFTAGGLGPYVWASDAASFDDLLVYAPRGGDPVSVVAHGDATAFDIDLRAATLPGRATLLALAFDDRPGFPLSLLDPADPRVVPLASDALLSLSLSGAPYFNGFTGSLDAAGAAGASVTLPLGLSGLSFYLSGVILDPQRPAGVAAVLPALPITLP